jgi:hypothetical protein
MGGALQKIRTPLSGRRTPGMRRRIAGAILGILGPLGDSLGNHASNLAASSLHSFAADHRGASGSVSLRVVLHEVGPQDGRLDGLDQLDRLAHR